MNGLQNPQNRNDKRMNGWMFKSGEIEWVDRGRDREMNG